jgi:ADP-ribose pyrophosphatase YjhB (NUDIX family)
MTSRAIRQWLLHGDKTFLKHVSVDCVVFGFHDNQLKVFLLKWKDQGGWCVPGGFVKRVETIEDSAARVLKERTGLERIFLRHFAVFSALDREKGKRPFKISGVRKSWYMERFVSIGFWALVEHSKVETQKDWLTEDAKWFDIQELPKMIFDHRLIVSRALEALRHSLIDHPVGYNLLPEKFTMPELQRLYETILGRPLDRRNFQKKMNSLGILERLNERKVGGSARKPPFLFRFNRRKYNEAMKKGLMVGGF